MSVVSICLSLLVFGPSRSTMEHVSLAQLLAATGAEAVGLKCGERGFDSVETDSRAVRAGDLFWAIKGQRHDGHDFVEQALRRGACAAVVQNTKQTDPQSPLVIVPNTHEALWRFARWYRRCRDALVIGVTGSFGKTTTRSMIHAVLSTQFVGTQSPGNYNNQFGVPLSILEIDAKHEFAVLEFGASSVGEIRSLAGIAEPEIGVVTGIGPAHLDGFGDEQKIVVAKGELVESLPETGFAVLWGDDLHVRQLADRASCRVLFVGENADNDLQATDVQIVKNRLCFTVHNEFFELPTAGRHHLSAALCAIAIAKEIGLEPADIAEALQSFRPPPGRCRLEQIGCWTIINDTYNANPTSMQAACRHLRDWQTAGRKLLIAGDMLELGTRTAEFHREFGRSAAESGIDHLLVHGQQARHVIGGAIERGMPTHRLAECENFDAVLTVLDCWLEPGDVVLVKGSRAMRMERVVEWLRARQRRQGPSSAVPLRACA